MRPRTSRARSTRASIATSPGARTGRNGRHPLPDPHDAGTDVRPPRHRRRRAGGGLRSGQRHVRQPAVVAAALDGARRGGGAGRRVGEMDGEGRATRSGAEPRAAREFNGSPRPGWPLTPTRSRAGRHARLAAGRRAGARSLSRRERDDRQDAGHIPGAVNHFFKWNLDERGTVPNARGDPRARARNRSATSPPIGVVCYCGSGVTACQNLLALEHAGLTGAKLYSGIVERVVERSVAAGREG